MTAVQTSAATARAPQLWPLDVKAYHALGELGLIPEKTELLYGQVYQKMPKSPLHRLLVMRLLALFQHLIPSGLHGQVEQPITCGDSEPEPDVSVIRGSIEDYRVEHPRRAELVVEVCVSTHEYDRSKLRAYASAGVAECWLVLVPEQQIEIHRRPHDGRYAETVLHGPGGSLSSGSVPGIVVELERLFAT
jgi:Uma2 family endonuclease